MRFITLLCISLLWACNNNSDDRGTQNELDTTTTTQTHRVMPPLTSDSIQWLASNVTGVLIDLYHYDATMDLKENQGARRAAYFISPESVESDISDCDPFAAIIYMGEGGVLFETEIYMEGQCSFIRFRKNNHIIHHNKITKQAFDFFSEILDKYQPPLKK